MLIAFCDAEFYRFNARNCRCFSFWDNSVLHTSWLPICAFDNKVLLVTTWVMEESWMTWTLNTKNKCFSIAVVHSWHDCLYSLQYKNICSLHSEIKSTNSSMSGPMLIKYYSKWKVKDVSQSLPINQSSW